VVAATPVTHDIAHAESLEAQEKALDLIANTADRICNIISTKGEADSVEAKGGVTAQLNGLASKLADIGISGSGSFNNESYQNVLRPDLPLALKDNAACKLKVFNSLQSKLLETAPTKSGSGAAAGPATPAPRSAPVPQSLSAPVPQPSPQAVLAPQWSPTPAHQS